MQQLLESIWAYEEWKCEKRIESDLDFVARAEELRRQRLNDKDRVEPNTSATPEERTRTQTGSANAGGAGDESPENSESVCVVCMSAARAVVLMPCGHLAVCQSCYVRLQQCPVCRTVIRGAIRSYT